MPTKDPRQAVRDEYVGAQYNGLQLGDLLAMFVKDFEGGSWRNVLTEKSFPNGLTALRGNTGPG